jgi:hypothetical protein
VPPGGLPAHGARQQVLTAWPSYSPDRGQPPSEAAAGGLLPPLHGLLHPMPSLHGILQMPPPLMPGGGVPGGGVAAAAYGDSEMEEEDDEDGTYGIPPYVGVPAALLQQAMRERG